MSFTYENAVDGLLGAFKTAWDTTGHTAYYESTVEDRQNEVSDPYDEDAFCQVWVNHFSGGQKTFGASGGRRFARIGELMVQIYCPAGKGLQESYALGKVLADAFEGTSVVGGMWFRNTRIEEKRRDGNFRRLDFFTEFSYDEIK